MSLIRMNSSSVAVLFGLLACVSLSEDASASDGAATTDAGAGYDGLSRERLIAVIQPLRKNY